MELFLSTTAIEVIGNLYSRLNQCPKTSIDERPGQELLKYNFVHLFPQSGMLYRIKLQEYSMHSQDINTPLLPN